MIEIGDPLNRTWSFDDNTAGALIAETSPSGATSTLTYDAASRTTSTVSPRGNEPGADPADFIAGVGVLEDGLRLGLQIK